MRICICGFVRARVCSCVHLSAFLCMCVAVITGGQADTTNGERCTAQTWQHTRGFQLLSLDSEIQEE